MRLFCCSGKRLFSCLLALPAMGLQAQTSLSVYSDGLVNGFQDWGWATHNYANASPVHSGSASASVTIATANFDGLQICRGTDLSSTPYSSLSFWINGGASGGQQLQVYGLAHQGSTNNFGQQLYVSLGTLQTNTWQQFTIPLSALGLANKSNFTGFVIQNRIGAVQSTFYVDDIQLDGNPPPALVHVNVNAAQTLRVADARWFGLNTAIWDGYFDTAFTSNALSELGTQILRFPGGSLSDEYHWATGKSSTNTWTWVTTFANFVHIATNARVQAMITVNYGTGASNEAAAWVRHANVTNHYAFKYWEVGNECYGTWETDSNTFPHDPYTYAVRAAGYITLMKQSDPTIKIGLPVVTGEDSSDNGYASHPAYNARTASYHNGWTPVVLTTLKSLGVTPDFIVHHIYPQYQNDSDATLLQASANWANDAANLRQQITDYVGVTGTNVEILCTENNADAGTQGRQSTSIVNGLYLADSLAQLMKTEINAFIWWDLRNGQDNQGAGGDFNPSLYGWRTYGDLGIIGNANTRYPTFYTFKLMQYFARPGDTVLNPTSDYTLLASHAARKSNGALNLLVINKHSASNLTAQIVLTNFFPWSTAVTRSFGIAQDEATRTNGPAAAQDIATNSLATASTNFMMSFPPYSLTLITFAPDAPRMRSVSAAGSQYIFRLEGQAGVPYQIQTSTNLLAWSSNSTATLSDTTWNVTNSISFGAKFWRAVWVP
ncbi:MAG TPA: alpha-L-arabinofuranosidase [Verrucomicrobiae bacterium]|nr:alpha-L-arabinofuranosidase [Verrucomicrobiae bacterium]